VEKGKIDKKEFSRIIEPKLSKVDTRNPSTYLKNSIQTSYASI
jgi:hypothetical protein